MAEYIEEKTAGQIQIADEVIAIIAGTAAGEVDGVVATAKGEGFLGFGKKTNPAKGVKVSVDEGTVIIDAQVAVIYGTKITEAAKKVQEEIKSAVENMTSLTVLAVNVEVNAVITKTKTEEE